MSCPTRRRRYDFAVAVAAPAAGARTMLVTLSPRFILVNNAGASLRVRQAGTDATTTLPPNGHVPWHWASVNVAQLLQVRRARAVATVVMCLCLSGGIARLLRARQVQCV